MKTIHYALTVLLVSGSIGITHAQENIYPAQPGPMMYGPPGPQGQPMMNPQMREQMMRMRQHRQMMMEHHPQEAAGPMAGEPHVCEHQGGVKDMRGEPHVCEHQGGVKDMRGERMTMVRKRMEMMDKHMQSIESHLSNIEELMKKNDRKDGLTTSHGACKRPRIHSPKNH